MSGGTKVSKENSETRHKNMVSIKSRDTSIEVKLRKMLWDRGIRYRKNYKALPGSPDIVLTKYRIAKIARNIDRDDAVNKQLIAIGWTVLRFWGRDILKYPDECLRAVEETIFENELRQYESDAERREETGEDVIPDSGTEE
ncbi:MAG: very short patch repair endonuclease [Lachnospiraceae bacterium]|nr:very short patch repair endonuclease [Lachnospiraceae bacterium]